MRPISTVDSNAELELVKIFMLAACFEVAFTLVPYTPLPNPLRAWKTRAWPG
jgi:hypothetical protein